jgi:hypothetical protein
MSADGTFSAPPGDSHAFLPDAVDKTLKTPLRSGIFKASTLASANALIDWLCAPMRGGCPACFKDNPRVSVCTGLLNWLIWDHLVNHFHGGLTNPANSKLCVTFSTLFGSDQMSFAGGPAVAPMESARG